MILLYSWTYNFFQEIYCKHWNNKAEWMCHFMFCCWRWSVSLFGFILTVGGPLEFRGTARADTLGGWRGAVAAAAACSWPQNPPAPAHTLQRFSASTPRVPLARPADVHHANGLTPCLNHSGHVTCQVCTRPGTGVQRSRLCTSLHAFDG